MAVLVVAARWTTSDLESVVSRLLILVAVGAVAYLGFGFLAFRSVFVDARQDLRTIVFGGRARRPTEIPTATEGG
jgi:hypothetical protein